MIFIHKKRSNIFKYLLIVFLILLVVISVSFFKTIKENNHVYSHRGASGEEIEHSYKAYDLAIDYGSKFIEQDLVTSKDHTLYVSHDLNAKRITGINKDYNKMTNAEISRLRTADGQHILKLEDVFNKYQGKTNFVIELKQNELQVEAFKKIVKNYKIQDDIIVQAKNLEVLKKLENTFPDMTKLLLVNTEDELNNALEYNCVDIVGANSILLNQKNVDRVHEKDKEFNVWTLDSTDEIEKGIHLNVDSYFTDYTAKALMLENKYR